MLHNHTHKLEKVSYHDRTDAHAKCVPYHFNLKLLHLCWCYRSHMIVYKSMTKHAATWTIQNSKNMNIVSWFCHWILRRRIPQEEDSGTRLKPGNSPHQGIFIQINPIYIPDTSATTKSTCLLTNARRSLVGQGKIMFCGLKWGMKSSVHTCRWTVWATTEKSGFPGFTWMVTTTTRVLEHLILCVLL